MLVSGCPGRKKDLLFPRKCFYLIIQNWFSHETPFIQSFKPFFTKTSFLLGSLWISQVKKCRLWLPTQPAVFKIVKMTNSRLHNTEEYKCKDLLYKHIKKNGGKSVTKYKACHLCNGMKSHTLFYKRCQYHFTKKLNYREYLTTI